MYLLGIDLGSSFIKLSVLDGHSGKVVAKTQVPDREMDILSPQPHWAEQNPDTWWNLVAGACRNLTDQDSTLSKRIGAIGISYQMHGLVTIDKMGRVLRPSIIWCDSRAIKQGESISLKAGSDHCTERTLNQPGNFTLSKLAWIKQNEPEIYPQIYKMCLPGDFIAYRMTAEIKTTISGLSEGILWDFKKRNVARFLLDAADVPADMIPEIVPTWGLQGNLTRASAVQMGLKPGTPITYRAGDQPNNAFSLRVLQPGEIAATAGTSGVIYAVSDVLIGDPRNRINSFAHVNYRKDNQLTGILLCINGTGILYRWLKENTKASSYRKMNDLANSIPMGSDGLLFLPFGNGAERLFENQILGASLVDLNLTRHTHAHLYRAAQEGIVFAICYGLELMSELGININVIRAGHANLFSSDLFTQMLSTTMGVPIELYNTDGSQGAARAAGIGVSYYSDEAEAFTGLERIAIVEPFQSARDTCEQSYANWKNHLKHTLNKVI